MYEFMNSRKILSRQTSVASWRQDKVASGKGCSYSEQVCEPYRCTKHILRRPPLNQKSVTIKMTRILRHKASEPYAIKLKIGANCTRKYPYLHSAINSDPLPAIAGPLNSCRTSPRSPVPSRYSTKICPEWIAPFCAAPPGWRTDDTFRTPPKNMRFRR